MHFSADSSGLLRSGSCEKPGSSSKVKLINGDDLPISQNIYIEGLYVRKEHHTIWRAL
jgi:hypothetical protein